MLSFEDYVSRRKAGESKESLQDSMRKESGEEGISASFSSGGAMSTGFENFVKLRKAGYSSEEIFAGGSEALQRQKKLQAAHERALEASRAAAATARQQQLKELGFDNEDDYLKAWEIFAQGKAESLGDAHHTLRKQTEEEAKDDYWSAFRQLFGNAAQSAQQGMWGVQARPEEQLARAKESAAADAQMREAKARQKDATRAIEWDGRQELIDELKALDDRASGWVTNEQQLAEYEEQRKKITDRLEAGDIAAGNGTRSYTVRDSVGHFITGTGENIGSGILAAGGALGRAGAQSQVLQGATNQDQFIIDALRGRGEENLQRQKEARELVQSEEFNAPFERVLDVAQGISDDAAKEIQTLKEGKSALGQAGIDIAENVVEMGFDAGVGAITGGGSLGSMFVRVMGSGVLEARQDGADPTQQLLYGAAKGGIEALTEKLFDGVAGIYGKGAADEITQDLIRRMTENRTGRALLLALSGAVAEGGEEVLSDLLSPLAEKIYKDESLRELYGQIEPSEVLYDFLIGAAIGGLGSVTSLVNGETREDLIDMDFADATEYESPEYRFKTAMDVLNGRVSVEEQQARDAEALARSERAWERLGLGEEIKTLDSISSHEAENLLSSGNNKVLGFGTTIREFVREAISSKGKGGRLYLGKIPAKTTELIKRKTGLDTTGFTSIANGSEIWHAYKNHSNAETESQRGHVALTEADFELLPQIIASPDDVYTTGEQDGSSRQGIVFKKRIGDTFVTVQGYSNRKQGLVFDTMWKIKGASTTRSTADQISQEHTSETKRGYGANSNISHEPVYVKGVLTPEVSTAKGAGKIYEVTNDGKVVVDLADGGRETMTPDEAGFTGAARTLFDAVQELGESSAEAYAAYPRDGSIDVDRYVAAWKTAEELGEMGLKPESVDKLLVTNVLEKDTRRQAYRMGQEKREARERIATPPAEARNDRNGEARAVEGAGPYEGDGEAQPKRGSVSFEGGTVGGVTYQGVSEEKARHLSRRQEAAVSASYALAEVTGFDFVFYEGESSKGAQGIYQQGGKIWLNINAGRHLGQDLIGFTMSHELTHAIQEWAPEQYDALRQFVVENVMQEDDLDALVTARRKAEPNLSFTEAVDEIVADGCEMMLKDSKAIRELAESNKTLAEKIGDVLREFVQKLREAFGDMPARHPEAQLLMQHAEEQQKLWDEGLKAAVQNRRAGNKNTAYKEGSVRYSIGNITGASGKNYGVGVVLDSTLLDNLTAAERVQMVKLYIESIQGRSFVAYDSSGNPVNVKVEETTKKFKNSKGRVVPVNRDLLTKHRTDEIKQETVVLADELINVAKEGRPTAAMHPHDWLDNNGLNPWGQWKSIVQDKSGAVWEATLQIANATTGEKILYDIHPIKKVEGRGNSRTTSTAKNIPQNTPNVKHQNSVSDSVSDRALLLEAAAREGASASKELRRFADRVKDLEGLQRRLERQEKKLGELKEAAKEKAAEIEEESRETEADLFREGEGERTPHQSAAQTASPRGEAIAALEGRIAETREEIRKKEDLIDRLEKDAKLQREVKKLRERWFKQNAAEAVEVQTQIQQENRELREALDFYKQQVKLSTTDQRTVRPEDVGRFARAILKEHGSEANLDTLRGKLQAIGDYLVSNGEGDGIDSREYQRMAREAARLIADETYTTAEDSELYEQLRDRVRNTRLQASDELKGDIPDYNAWRKSQLGRLTLANDGLPIDTFYQELGESFGEGFFPADITAHSDQINRILEVLEQQRPKPQYAYTEGERDIIIKDITNEIMDVMLSGEIRESETMADRNYRRMQEITRQAQEKAREAKNTLEEERSYRKELVREKTSLIRQELKDSAEKRQRRESIERLRKNLLKKLEENSGKRHVPEELKKTLAEWLGSINTLSGYASEAQMQKYLDEMDKLRQIAAKAQSVDYGTELDLPGEMADMLQQHINEAKAAMKEGRGNIHLMSVEQLRELEDALNIVTHAITNANILLADGGPGHWRELSEVAESSIKHMGEMSAMKMERGFRRTMRSFMQWDNTTPVYAFKRFGEGGEAIYKSIVRGWSKMAMNAKQVLDFAENLYSADYARKAEKEIFEFELYKRVEEDNGERIATPPSEARNDSEEGNYNSIGDGQIRGERETVRMTRAQLMSLYGLMLREQARGHLLGAGIRVADFKDAKGNIVPQAENYILYTEDIAAMESKLSEKDKEIVREMVKYMSTVGSEWGNRVSMKRRGIRAFTEDNYFPIKTDSRNRDAKTPDGEEAGLYRLPNMSFTKNTVQEANNAIILESVFDVFANHMADMAKYEALALPIVDAMRWFNFKEQSDPDNSGHYSTQTMQKSMERAYGSEAGKYFLNFIQDLNGSQEGGRGEGRLKALMSNYKVAAVSANLRVMIQQPTSIARAALLLDPKYIMKGIGMKGGIQEAMKHSGLAVWKSLGYFDTNINRGIREQIKHEDSWRDTVNEYAMKGAELGDKVIWGALWNACKIEQAEKLGIRMATAANGLAMTEEYKRLMEATAERFNEVIVSTQVMDSTITRSQAMRSTSMIMSQLAAFKSEPTLTYNTLLDAYMDYAMDKRKGEPAALKKHSEKIGRTALVWCVSQTLTAFAAALVDVARDDDDYETMLEKLVEHWRSNKADNMNALSYLPIIDQLQDVARGNAQELMVFEGAVKAVNAAKVANEMLGLKFGWVKEPTSLTYNGKMTTWGAVYKGLQGTSFLAGLPLAGASRDVVAICNVFLNIFGKKSVKTYDAGAKNEIKYAFLDGWLSEEEAARYLIEEKVSKNREEAEKLVYEWSLDGAGDYDAVKAAALKQDKTAFEKAMKELEANHYGRESAESAIRSEVKKAYQPDEDGKQKLGKQQAIRILQEYGGLSREKAEKQVQEWTCYVVTGIKHDEIDDAYLNGEITLSRAKQLRATYGGYDEEETESKAFLWKWQKENPAYEDMSESAANNYYDIGQPMGITARQFYEFWKETKDLHSDKDAEGKDIKGQTKKDKTLAFIHSMPLSTAQKDALYFAAGYKESGLQDAPWHASD